jgi:hypothetical protein
MKVFHVKKKWRRFSLTKTIQSFDVNYDLEGKDLEENETPTAE